MSRFTPTGRDAAVQLCPTCSAACPVHTDTRAYVELITQGRYEEALEKIREFNPFPSVCSLICHHPCEQACRRAEVDDPVALRHLKRFVVEQTVEHRRRTRRPATITQAETVGVVGAGPSGLTAAHDLVRRGYAVTVYEAHSRPGGLLAWATPRYRLPEEALQQDLDDILALGVELRTGVVVGEDVSLEELRARHEAVVLATGRCVSRELPMTGADHPDVVPALPFLAATAARRPVDVPDEVIVIGGGNVAVDAARTAVRLGAEVVRMVCLESAEEMPAWDWECREALEEGIEIVHRRGPTDVIVEGGEVRGLVVREVERVFDEEGRFRPSYFSDCLSTVEGRMVIVAVGQRAELGFAREGGLELTEEGLLAFDPETMTTSTRGVFACGEVVTGPGSAVEAVAGGHRAALAALAYLGTGRIQAPEEPPLREVDELPQEIAEQVRRIERVAVPTVPPEERRRSFAQFEGVYEERDAIREAFRCLSCTAGAEVDEAKCDACLTCLRVCPFGVPVVDETARMFSELCQACGLCATECPACAISIKRYSVGEFAGRIRALMENASQPVTRLEIVCAQDAETRADLVDRVMPLNGEVVGRVPVPCAALADEVDMMKAFELGARTVIVRRCAECAYRGADGRLEKRVARTRQLLAAAGIGGERLTLI